MSRALKKRWAEEMVRMLANPTEAAVNKVIKLLGEKPKQEVLDV